MDLVKIALAQMQMDLNGCVNVEKTKAYIAEAAQEKAEIICFPELQLTHFFPKNRKGESSPEKLSEAHPVFAELKQSCLNNKINAVFNFYYNENGKDYDASPVVNSEGVLLGISKMVHIVQVPNFYEQDYYAEGDDGFKVYTLNDIKIGVVVCFDRHFPESFRSCALKGADIVFIPTANTTEEPDDLFTAEIRVSAMQNGLFIAMCNRVGQEEILTFSGASIVVDPMGNIITKANSAEQIVYADLDISKIKVARIERPYLALRRPNQYNI